MSLKRLYLLRGEIWVDLVNFYLKLFWRLASVFWIAKTGWHGFRKIVSSKLDLFVKFHWKTDSPSKHLVKVKIIKGPSKSIHSEVCGLLWVTRALFLESDVAAEFLNVFFYSCKQCGSRQCWCVCWQISPWVHHFCREWNISTTTGLTAIKFGSDIHASHRKWWTVNMVKLVLLSTGMPPLSLWAC